jgi:hypothetical protein
MHACSARRYGTGVFTESHRLESTVPRQPLQCRRCSSTGRRYPTHIPISTQECVSNPRYVDPSKMDIVRILTLHIYREKKKGQECRNPSFSFPQSVAGSGAADQVIVVLHCVRVGGAVKPFAGQPQRALHGVSRHAWTMNMPPSGRHMPRIGVYKKLETRSRL